MTRSACCSSGATRDDFADVDSLKYFNLDDVDSDDGADDFADVDSLKHFNLDNVDGDEGDEDFAEVDCLRHIFYEYDPLCNHNGCDDDDDDGKRRKGHQIWKRLSLKGISLPL